MRIACKAVAVVWKKEKEPAREDELASGHGDNKHTHIHSQDLANTCPDVYAPPKTLKLLARNSEGSKKVSRASSETCLLP